MLDLAECATEACADLALCRRILYELPDLIGMTRITDPTVFEYEGVIPEDKGITGMVIIAESHISLHTFTEKNFVFMDIFSCMPFAIEDAKKFAIDCFKSKQPKFHYAERGQFFPRRGNA